MEGIKNTKKLKILLILLCISIFVYAFFPTLARYKNRLDLESILNSPPRFYLNSI